MPPSFIPLNGSIVSMRVDCVLLMWLNKTMRQLCMSKLIQTGLTFVVEVIDIEGTGDLADSSREALRPADQAVPSWGAQVI